MQIKVYADGQSARFNVADATQRPRRAGQVHVDHLPSGAVTLYLNERDGHFDKGRLAHVSLTHEEARALGGLLLGPPHPAAP